MKKLHILPSFSKLVVAKLLTANALRMRNFIINFVRILGICKDFAANRVNEHGTVPRCGVVPKFSDLEVIALGMTAPVWAYKRFRKRIETVFSQLNDHLMMLRNYAKQSCGLFARITGKIAAMTIMQYVNFVNHRPIGQIKYALF